MTTGSTCRRMSPRPWPWPQLLMGKLLTSTYPLSHFISSMHISTYIHTHKHRLQMTDAATRAFPRHPRKPAVPAGHPARGSFRLLAYANIRAGKRAQPHVLDSQPNLNPAGSSLGQRFSRFNFLPPLSLTSCRSHRRSQQLSEAVATL